MKKRILIYGFNGRTGSLAQEKRYVTIAKLLQVACLGLGHEVHVGYPTEGLSESTIKEYDRVFIGLASPNSIISDRTYVASYILGHLWNSGKLVLFFDDPDIRKFFYGVTNFLQDPTPKNVFRSAFKKRKLWYDPVVYPGDAARWSDWHINVLKSLVLDSAEEYPPVIIPTFPWFDLPRFTTYIPDSMRKNLVQIDPTSMLSVQPQEHMPEVERTKEWVVDQVRTAKKDEASTYQGRRQIWLQYQKTIFPITAMRERVSDSERVHAYQKAWGTLELPSPATSVGWWSKDMTYAIQMGALYITDPSQVIELGAPFNLLAASTEHLSMDERDELAEAQKKRFLEMTWTPEQLTSAFEELI